MKALTQLSSVPFSEDIATPRQLGSTSYHHFIILSHPCPPHPTWANVLLSTSCPSPLPDSTCTADDTHYTKTVLLAPLKTFQLFPSACWRKTQCFRQACNAFCDLAPTHLPAAISTMAFFSSLTQSLARWHTIKYKFSIQISRLNRARQVLLAQLQSLFNTLTYLVALHIVSSSFGLLILFLRGVQEQSCFSNKIMECAR